MVVVGLDDVPAHETLQLQHLVRYHSRSPLHVFPVCCSRRMNFRVCVCVCIVYRGYDCEGGERGKESIGRGIVGLRRVSLDSLCDAWG